uniref:NADH dehydrogenase subunit 2 n=1 Tax=Barbatia decussata TaxID=1508519 RepID=UPI00202926F2|nr:NADH dehydrogenase subunit 2 [Barbatia decussata]UQT66009.1 NADH dehydrogenase subunit 2 [Barbatia decussata]
MGGRQIIRGVEWWVHVYSFVLLVGVIVVLSSSSWFGAWVGMEMSFIGFICHVSVIHGENFWDGLMSFVLNQAVASMLLLFSFTAGSMLGVVWKWVAVSALLWKMGMPPFHWWYPKVIGNLGWCSIWLLSTLMKMGPLVLVGIVAESSSSFISVMVCVGYVFSGVVGISQNTVRGVLAYSSMGNCCWLVMACSFSSTLFWVFFVVYSLSMGVILFLCAKDSVSAVSGSSMMSRWVGILLSIVVLSLAGIPPFIGFGPKVMVALSAISESNWAVVVMLVGSVIHAYYYLSFVVSGLASKVLSVGFSQVSMGVVVFGVIAHVLGACLVAYVSVI